MNTFMLWYDNDPKTQLADKIERAVKYYQEKYGMDPDLVVVNPKALAAGQPDVAITVRTAGNCLPGHMWIGRSDAGRGSEIPAIDEWEMVTGQPESPAEQRAEAEVKMWHDLTDQLIKSGGFHVAH